MTTPIHRPALPPPPSAATPRTLTARTPEDVLALVPVVLGFVPADSVVMLTFGAAHAFHARVDLPPPEAGAAGAAELADVLLDPAERHGVERVVLLVYSEHPDRAAPVWEALRRRCRSAGVAVVDALRVTPTHYHPLLARHPGRRGVGVAYDVATHPFQVQAVVDGRVTHPTRSDLAATLTHRPVAVAVTERLVASLPDWSAAGPDDAVLLTEGAWVHDLVARHAAADTRPDDVDLARLLRDLQVVVLRDAAWVGITRPRAREHVGLWADVVRRTPTSLLAPPATLLAWSAWQRGDGALAWCALDRARAGDPDYPLMLLVAEALEQAVPPSAVDAGFDWAAGLRAG